MQRGGGRGVSVRFSGLEASYRDLVRRIVDHFNAGDLDYMFTGAVAASFYGIPRTTMDVDIVVEISNEGQQAKLVSVLRQIGLWVDEKKIDVALKSGYRLVSLRDNKSPYSVDVIFSRNKRLEKRAGTIEGLPTFFQAPEDLILAKLRMIKATVPRERALKDEEDVRAILKFTKVDVEAVKTQARRNNTLSILESVTG
jgi:hypothetical protein